MPRAKIAITLDVKDLRELDELVDRGAAASRSELIQGAVHEKLVRLERTRLARECGKLEIPLERAEAEQRLVGEVAWPEY